MVMLNDEAKLANLAEVFTNDIKIAPHFQHEFGHLEADTFQGKAQQGAVMTLVERLSKVEIILDIQQRSAERVNKYLGQWLSQLLKHFFKSITFDNVKEFTGWKEIANKYDISTYFTEVRDSNQRVLNENNNGLIRRDGLKKNMDFRNLPNALVQQVSSRCNHIPRKSLNYKTPIEISMKNITDK